jgi:hypothetical protein
MLGRRPSEGGMEETVEAEAAPPGLVRVRRVALRVALLSLLLVVVLEALLVLGEAATGTLAGMGTGAVLADLLGKVPWSLFVCTGVWLGLELGRGRPPLSLLGGLVAAPIGALLLRAVAEGFHAFSIAGEPAGPSPLLVAAIKGIEYACLGFLVGWLGRRTWAAMYHHAAAGLAVAIPFGGVLLLATAAASHDPLGPGQISGWAVNEVLFPIGCALILYSAGRAERAGA